MCLQTTWRNETVSIKRNHLNCRSVHLIAQAPISQHSQTTHRPFQGIAPMQKSHRSSKIWIWKNNFTTNCFQSMKLLVCHGMAGAVLPGSRMSCQITICRPKFFSLAEILIALLMHWAEFCVQSTLGSCTYYVITFGGPERPLPPLCNIVIIWAYPPPLCNTVIIWPYPPYVKL